MMQVSKKGIFFTLISLTLVTIITYIFTQSTAGLVDNGATSTRITVLDSFISQVEGSYLPLALQTATFKGVQATVQYMDAQDTWLTSPETGLGSIIANGSLGAQKVMVNNTLSNFTRNIERSAAKAYGMELAITINSVRLAQTVPWQLDAIANVSVIGKSDVGNWSRQGVVVSTTLSIEGLPDPQYTVRTDGYYNKTIRRAAFQPSWGIARLADLVASGNYTRFEGADAPSFLERFRSSPAPSACCGIESTINDGLLPPAMRNQQKSYADYQFWSSANPCPGDLYDISGAGVTPFRLDFDHVIKYGVSGQSTANC